MAINELDDTICLYTVGREDCKVLPLSFKTLSEAEAYLAKQDEGALERGEFYLDGPERDKAATNCIADGISVNPIPPVPTATKPVEATPNARRFESPTTRGAWTRQIEELCRALEAQPSAQGPSTDAKKK